MTDKKTVEVITTIVIDGDVKTFQAEATTTNDPYDIAQGLLSGLDAEADRWLCKSGAAARRGY